MLFIVTLLTLCTLTANAFKHLNTQPAPCSCSSGFIPVSADVVIPVDPSDPAGLNSTNTMRLKTTFDVYGMLCEPVSGSRKSSSTIQLLLHGVTYNMQYWDVTWGGFQNYSYIAYSCMRGISSFAYDNLDAGQTIRQNSTHVQLPSVASVSSSLAKDLKSGEISRVLAGSDQKYDKVIAIGHSQGSATLNYAVITEGAHSPFDGLILTGLIHGFSLQSGAPALPPASVINPGRWANLDPGYITTPNGISARSVFYGPDNGTSFSTTILQLDELTKDAGTRWIGPQLSFLNAPAVGFRAPMIEMIGSADQLFCHAGGVPCDQATLQISEAMFFPDSSNFTMIVLDGYGHDLNYQFGAAEEFPILAQFVESFVS